MAGIYGDWESRLNLSQYSTPALAASGVIKDKAGALYNLSGINDKAAIQYIQIFDSKTVPADGAVPVLVLVVSADSNFSIDLGVYGLPCKNGISWSNSSTLATKTIGAADCFVTAVYR